MIHRDIKPSNLLRADNGEVKIADLGVSDEFDGLDARLTATAGTPAFTPPECLNTGASGDFSGKAVDIWSLGVTLFCLVTGRLPFPGATVVEVYDKINREDPEVRVFDNQTYLFLNVNDCSSQLSPNIARMSLSTQFILIVIS